MSAARSATGSNPTIICLWYADMELVFWFVVGLAVVLAFLGLIAFVGLLVCMLDSMGVEACDDDADH